MSKTTTPAVEVEPTAPPYGLPESLPPITSEKTYCWDLREIHLLLGGLQLFRALAYLMHANDRDSIIDYRDELVWGEIQDFADALSAMFYEADGSVFGRLHDMVSGFGIKQRHEAAERAEQDA